MKTRYIKLTLIFCLITALFACKKDLGNYDYNDPGVATVDETNIAAVYNIEQYAKLTVSPTVNYPGDTSNLSYQWITYVKSSSSVTLGTPSVISTKKVLDVALPTPPGAYYLEFIVTDKSNNGKTNARTLLNVSAPIETGWLVLHSLGGQSDVDFIASTNLSPTGPTKRMSNLFQTIQGAKLDGEGQMLGFARRSNSLFNYIMVATNKTIKRVNGFTFALMGTDQELFRTPLAAKNFQAFINNGSNDLLINDGKLQQLPYGVIQDALYNNIYNGDYSLAPYLVFNELGTYGALVYDQKFQKFMYTGQALGNYNFIQFLPAATTAPIPSFSPSNVGKNMLFMDRGFNKYAYAFFKDNTGNGRYMYVLNVGIADAGRLAVATYDMTALPEITQAKFFQVGELGNVALYATDKNVYRFDYSGTRTATVAFNGLPAAETITCMRIFKPVLNPNAPKTEFTLTNSAVVYVATWDGTQGRLYELAINVASGVISPTPLKVYTGFGKISDMTAKFRGTGT
ncbi:hypothetical protein EZ449_19715 [Pedobacter frigidisoli]|uniref:PKD-like family protein n=1 Tax=Pedobacter frigidisoli TaxID=2530455 RepID=A0A4R0NJ84_9SPHI|nr:PKD-like family lipoprotein [Pedobacter frigidisoli]TCD00731.1 hypothetical protein EZ449_19715 [Pedobacter frigidisoli]